LGALDFKGSIDVGQIFMNFYTFITGMDLFGGLNPKALLNTPMVEEGLFFFHLVFTLTLYGE